MTNFATGKAGKRVRLWTHLMDDPPTPPLPSPEDTGSEVVRSPGKSKGLAKNIIIR